MALYGITETEGSIAAATWQPVKAKTMLGAMRSATANQLFHGTTLGVAIATPDGGWKPLAIKQPKDKLNMASGAQPWRILN